MNKRYLKALFVETTNILKWNCNQIDIEAELNLIRESWETNGVIQMDHPSMESYDKAMMEAMEKLDKLESRFMRLSLTV